MDIIELLTEKIRIKSEIENLIFGSVEIRNKNGQKYIYVHFRKQKSVVSRYVGAYSTELHNMILHNNTKVKLLKKELKRIEKMLVKSGYKLSDLPLEIVQNIEHFQQHLPSMISGFLGLEKFEISASEIENILRGEKLANISAEEQQKILNIKQALDFIMEESIVQVPANFSLLCQINKFVLKGFYFNAGQVQSKKQGFENEIKSQIESILTSQLSISEKATELLLLLLNQPIFVSGNFTSAFIFVNHFLIQNACGFLHIPNDEINEFNQNLTSYIKNPNNLNLKIMLKKFIKI